jgi:CheY-like chemotaxis protein
MIGAQDPLIEAQGRKPHTGVDRAGDQAPITGGGRLPRRCVVIDDQRVTLEVVAKMLSVLGYGVDTAETKVAVTTLLAANAYDLIVTDLKMPEMDGYQFAIEVKNRDRSVKVIIMTGCHKNDCMAMMQSGGADGWIFKPFGLKELIHKLKRLELPAPQYPRQLESQLSSH